MFAPSARKQDQPTQTPAQGGALRGDQLAHHAYAGCLTLHAPLQPETVHSADVPSNAGASYASLRHRVVPRRSPSPPAMPHTSSKTIKSFQPSSRLKLAVPPSTTADPEVDDAKDNNPEPGQLDGGDFPSILMAGVLT